MKKMKLVMVLGPPAVGKMTVGQKLAEITDLKLLHNHMTYELVNNFFNVRETEEGGRLNILFRDEILKAVAKSGLPGLIFTGVVHFGEDNNLDYPTSIIELFESHNAKTEAYVAELCADLDIRIARSKTENRLINKPSWRNIQDADELLRRLDSENQFNSMEGEILPFKNHLKIDNTNLQPEDVALRIKEVFAL